MTVHQLSVFIENKSGALVRVLRLLKQENIQLIATTIADTVDYGIFRIICSQPEKAYNVLRDAGVAVSLCEVLAVELDDRPGTSWQIDGETMETVKDFIFLGSKITADGDCSHEIK